jgi:hypothetical protein
MPSIHITFASEGDPYGPAGAIFGNIDVQGNASWEGAGPGVSFEDAIAQNPKEFSELILDWFRSKNPTWNTNGTKDWTYEITQDQGPAELFSGSL